MADGKIIIDARISTVQTAKDAKTLKSQAASIAAEYRKQGLNQSAAMKQAWADIRQTTKSGAKNTRQIINTEFEGAAADMKRTFAGIGSMLASVISVSAIISVAKECIQLGSDVAEVQNVVDTAFGAMAYKMEEFADTAITSYGISQLAAKKTGSNYMAMARGMGLADEAASNMAITLTGLSADVASFYNLSQDEAATKLKSVFTGETETLKDLGVVMTQTNLQQYALNKGIKKNITAMTQAELTTLRYNFVLDSLSLASGDFIRTQDSWANQTRILSEQMKQLGANVGQILTTVLLPAVRTINQIVANLVAATDAVVDAINVIQGNQEQNNSTASSANAAADAEYALADGIEAASTAAKKAQAGFDELNILQSGATGSAGGSSGVSDFLSNFESGSGVEISDQMKDFAENIAQFGVTINDVFFEWEDLSGEQIAEKAIAGLGALVGAGLGFVIGGVPGAIKGALIGVGLGVMISSIIFDGDGELSAEEISKSLVAALSALTGGIIGFSLGGPAGAAIGALIGVGLVFSLLNTKFDGESKLGNIFSEGTGSEQDPGKRTFADDMIDLFNVGNVVDSNFIGPTKVDLKNFGDWISEWVKEKADTIIKRFSEAGTQVDSNFVQPSWDGFSGLGDWISEISRKAKENITGDFTQAHSSIDSNFILPTQDDFKATGEIISQAFEDASDWAKEKWSDMGEWFETTVFDPVTMGFKNLVNGGISGLNGLIGGVESAINWCVRALNNFSIDLPDWDILGDMAGGTFGFSLNTVSFDRIPHLARGAVIPPNREFLAVLGDQSSGTNVEAPLSTIQEAVAAVMEDMIQSNAAGHEATIALLGRILEAIYELDTSDERYARAVDNHNRMMAVARGGL